jgi:hypothetical protein
MASDCADIRLVPMTLLAAVLTPRAVFLGADSQGITPNADKKKGYRNELVKFHQVGSAPLMWGAAGHTATAFPFSKWLGAQNLTTWERLAKDAEYELAAINDREDALSKGSRGSKQPHSERRSQVVVGGHLDERFDVLALPNGGLSSLLSDYLDDNQRETVLFSGGPEVDAQICWEVVKRVSPPEQFGFGTFSRFMEAFVQCDARLGGPVRIWKVTKQEALQVWPKAKSEAP